MFILTLESDNGDTGTCPETPKNHAAHAPRRSTRTSANRDVRKTPSSYKDGNIKNYLSRTRNDHPPVLDPNSSKLQQLSSDDYRIDDSLFDDVEMQDVTVTIDPQKISAKTGLGLDVVWVNMSPLDHLRNNIIHRLTVRQRSAQSLQGLRREKFLDLRLDMNQIQWAHLHYLESQGKREAYLRRRSRKCLVRCHATPVSVNQPMRANCNWLVV